MGQSGQEDKKKIKTESGQYISSSYKRDLYPKGQTDAEGQGGAAYNCHTYRRGLCRSGAGRLP